VVAFNIEHNVNVIAVWTQHAQSESQAAYRLAFTNIKPVLHDKLYLSWTTPHGIHIFEHDGQSGMVKGGVEDNVNIHLVAPGGVPGCANWRNAEKFLLKHMGAKRGWRLPYIAFIKFAEGDNARFLERAMEIGTDGGDEEEDEDENPLEELMNVWYRRCSCVPKDATDDSTASLFDSNGAKCRHTIAGSRIMEKLRNEVTDGVSLYKKVKGRGRSNSAVHAMLRETRVGGYLMTSKRTDMVDDAYTGIVENIADEETPPGSGGAP